MVIPRHRCKPGRDHVHVLPNSCSNQTQLAVEAGLMEETHAVGNAATTQATAAMATLGSHAWTASLPLPNEISTLVLTHSAPCTPKLNERSLREASVTNTRENTLMNIS